MRPHGRTVAKAARIEQRGPRPHFFVGRVSSITPMAEIYALFSSRDGRVRYVGQTSGSCADRFAQHLRRPSPTLYDWFHKEWRDGYPIEYVLLQSCEDDVRTAVERRWMMRFPHLLNERMSAQIWFTSVCSKAPKMPDITAYMRRYLFNVGGFRGVHYDRHWDRFRVLIYTGLGPEWLVSNHCMPGWGGNIWFPDRTAALVAREAARRRRRVEFSPDVELAE